MIVLDTNVVSELIRAAPSHGVLRWVDEQEASHLVLTAVTAAELRAGAQLLPEGRRQRDLTARIEELLTQTFTGSILPFDDESSSEYATVVAARSRAGRPIAALDAQIAAIRRSHAALLATRNVRDFVGTDVDVVDPWSLT